MMNSPADTKRDFARRWMTWAAFPFLPGGCYDRSQSAEKNKWLRSSWWWGCWTHTRNVQRQFGSFISRPKNVVGFVMAIMIESDDRRGKMLLHHNNLIKMIILDDLRRFSQVYGEWNWESIDQVAIDSDNSQCWWQGTTLQRRVCG